MFNKATSTQNLATPDRLPCKTAYTTLSLYLYMHNMNDSLTKHFINSTNLGLKRVETRHMTHHKHRFADRSPFTVNSGQSVCSCFFQNHTSALMITKQAIQSNNYKYKIKIKERNKEKITSYQ